MEKRKNLVALNSVLIIKRKNVKNYLCISLKLLYYIRRSRRRWKKKRVKLYHTLTLATTTTKQKKVVYCNEYICNFRSRRAIKIYRHMMIINKLCSKVKLLLFLFFSFRFFFYYFASK